MSLWRQLTFGLTRLVRRSEADRDVADEIQHYLDEAAAEHRARGLSREAAGRAARLELGGETRVAEQVQGYGWETVVEASLADLRYAVRGLVSEPIFAGATILTVAIGIGATTAIFSAVNTILLQPLPYPDSTPIVSDWDRGGRAKGPNIEKGAGGCRPNRSSPS